MTAANSFDGILKELGELYEFNREIQRFEWKKKVSYGVCELAERVAEDTPEYKTGKD